MDVRYLILSLTTRCNLSCAYCYNGDMTDGLDMSEAVLMEALRLVEKGKGPFHLQLTGGEPTLVPQLIEQTVVRARSLSRPCTIGIQTNGTLLSPELLEFLKNSKVQVGISLDGPPKIQEAIRGKASQTLRGLQMMENSNVPFRVTTVITQNNVLYLSQLVLVLTGFDLARGIGLDLLVMKGRAARADDISPADPQSLRIGVSAFLKALKEVNSLRRTPMQLRELELLQQAWPGNVNKHTFCHACLGHSIAVHPDGRLFPCGQALGDANFAAGTVWQPEPERLMNLSLYTPTSGQCDKCPVNGRCPGECPSRLHYNQAYGPALACELYRTLWKYGKDRDFDLRIKPV